MYERGKGMAKYQNIVSTDRHRLEEVIPLKTPYTLAVDPSNICNFKCAFCAVQSKEEKLSFRRQLMPMELFCKIMDDLTEFPDKLKVLRVNGQGEPLLNPNFAEMVKYAKQKNVADFVETITNGSMLNPERNQQIIDSGIDRIRISIENITEKGYQEIAGAKVDFESLRANIKDLHERSGKCEIYCKIVDAAVPTEEDRKQFFSLFGDICDRIFIDHVIPMWSDFGELNQRLHVGETGVHGQKVQSIRVCPFPFYSLIVNSDGEVTACCPDWKRKLVLGDLKTESMMEIWNGKKLRTFWKALLGGQKNTYEMCEKCVLPMYDCNDNIDEYAEEILSRMSLS
jgi:MoaA/NifB/PqqE/SkfB family radical SAM enzyme